MPDWSEAERSALIDRICEHEYARPGGAPEDGERFLRHYFARMPLDEVADNAPDCLAGLAFAHMRLAAVRSPGQPTLRAYHPQVDEDGWRSELTAVQIVTDDIPFLVDSVSAAFAERQIAVRRVIHPVFAVVRDRDDRWLRLARGDDDREARPESFMHFEVARQPQPDLPAVVAAIAAVLADVRAAVEDWQDMVAELGAASRALASPPAGVDAVEAAEARAFLDWLGAGRFTYLGYRRYRIEEPSDDAIVRIEAGSGRGVLRDPATIVFDDLREGALVSPAARAFVARREVVVVTKTNRRATVSRPVLTDAIVVKFWNGDGRLAGARVFTGLFSHSVYNDSIGSIPLLRRKVQTLLGRSGYAPRSHDGRALLNIAERFPRDELFQTENDALWTTARGILGLRHRPRTALFLRADPFGRSISALIFVPRDRYDTTLRITVESLLETAFAGTVIGRSTQLGNEPLARLSLLIKTTPGAIPPWDAGALEREIAAAARSWGDRLSVALVVAHGEDDGCRLARRYGEAFPLGYQERYTAGDAVADIAVIEDVLDRGSLGLALDRAQGLGAHEMRLKLYHPNQPIALSQVVPVLENFGLRVIDEVPHRVRVGAGNDAVVVLHDIGVTSDAGLPFDLPAVRAPLFAAFRAVWSGMAENDRLNALVLAAGLDWREITVLRAYTRFLRQVGTAFGHAYMLQALVTNAAITRSILALFSTLCDPAGDAGREDRAAELRRQITAALDNVAGADDDRILRRYLNLIEATLRTNHFQVDANGAPSPCLALKLDSRRIDELPLPRPWVEIFVYSPRVEGVHLRGGKVARGGIRWSDRRDDFRTEILGLMKAQMVKNAVIVPVGAKGGFYVKQPPPGGDRDTLGAEGIACYRLFIQALLDVTDNFVAGGIVPPANVVRRDGDDPYLVVAADKGTASFSDIANGIAAANGFWLGDAFASGGSLGYDHKGMGITARGAWVAVERHFAETGIDIARPFDVVGVGDMSGDVFGNGMLLSQHIRLLAAFDHRHVFIDPDPDPAASFAERGRLFTLPRSSWADYDPTVLSPGGQVFARSAKTVVLSPEARARFGVAAERSTPADIVRALLSAPVDLLWFGGIGTFVKAGVESHADAGDRANDAVRIDARQLRAKVIGEGANLALTQRARIEYALQGGRLNADFIDNSAGVDCSDHEVNIKILLDAAVVDGDLSVERRNQLLVAMTDDVAALVLHDNALQCRAISLIEFDGVAALDRQLRLMRLLERQGVLDRKVESLPDDEVLTERAQGGIGLTRPEIAVLFSSCKIWLYDRLLDSGVPDDRYLADSLERYFPRPLRQPFRTRMPHHRLRRELVATLLTNSLINRVGGVFVSDLHETTGAGPADIAHAYVIARDVFRVREIWDGIEALAGRVVPTTQATLYRQVRMVLDRATRWFLSFGPPTSDLASSIDSFQPAVTALSGRIETLLPNDANDRIRFRADRYVSSGVPTDLARRIAYLIVLIAACDIVRLAADRGTDLDRVARLYFAAGEQFGFGWLRYQAEKQPVNHYWQRLAVASVIEELYAEQRSLTARILAGPDAPPQDAIASWREERRAVVERTEALLAEMRATGATDLAMLTVATRQLAALING